MTRANLFLTVAAVAGLLSAACQSGHIRPQPNAVVEIPFTLTAHNNIVVAAVVNDRDRFDLMLHTAATDVMLTEDAVRRATAIAFAGNAQVESWGGRSESRYSVGNRLRVGGLERDGVRIVEDKNSGYGTDGKFGLDFFRGHVVEIDFDHRRIAVYDRVPEKAAGYRTLDLINEDDSLFVEADCMIDGKAYRNRFLIHSGYSGGVLLDDDFAARSGVDGKIAITEESALQDSFGNTIKVKKGVLPAFVLGGARVVDVPTGFFSGAIGTQKMSVIGGDVLKRFNLIFDVAGGRLYLAPREGDAAVGG